MQDCINPDGHPVKPFVAHEPGRAQRPEQGAGDWRENWGPDKLSVTSSFSVSRES